MTRRLLTTTIALLAGLGTLAVDTPEASAQEIQLTGPLAGAPAVRKLRLHRAGRWDVGLHSTFSLLDEYRRTIMPGIRASYHFTDSFGVGVFGGYGIQYNAALADELQEKAVNGRNCAANPSSLACKRTAVSLCRNGEDCLAENQFGRIQWMAAPQVTLVPFRGKISLFSRAFIDTDISVFVGGAIIGLQERKDCTKGACADPSSFALETRITGAPTFGLGFNLYPLDYLAFGAEFRGTPFSWNTSGFDTSSEEEDGPDNIIDSNDRTFHFNPMLSVYVSMQLPMQGETSD